VAFFSSSSYSCANDSIFFANNRSQLNWNMTCLPGGVWNVPSTWPTCIKSKNINSTYKKQLAPNIIRSKFPLCARKSKLFFYMISDFFSYIFVEILYSLSSFPFTTNAFRDIFDNADQKCNSIALIAASITELLTTLADIFTIY
jgi:hypothetical protein